MSFSKINDFKNIEVDIIENEIILLKKNLFDLRIKKGTGQKFSSHLFKHYRHKLNQLKMLLSKKINN